jgi:hypothetical protein
VNIHASKLEVTRTETDTLDLRSLRHANPLDLIDVEKLREYAGTYIVVRMEQSSNCEIIGSADTPVEAARISQKAGGFSPQNFRIVFVPQDF